MLFTFTTASTHPNFAEIKKGRMNGATGNNWATETRLKVVFFLLEQLISPGKTKPEISIIGSGIHPYLARCRSNG